MTHIATKSIPIVSNLFKAFAISILVPTPSVEATIFGFLNFFGISDIEPKPPIFLNFDLFLLCFAFFDKKSTNLSAAVIFTPLFSYVNFLLFIKINYVFKYSFFESEKSLYNFF